MALLHSSKVLLLLYLLAPQFEAFLKLRDQKHAPRIRIHLEEDEHILVPKHSKIKYLNNFPILGIIGGLHPSPVGAAGHIPTTGSDAIVLNPSLPKITSDLHKKRPQIKYIKHTTAYGKLTGSAGSGGDELLRPVSIVVPAHQLFGTVHQSHHPVLQHLSHHHLHHAYPNVKPVTEHIEDDLKYDFRTKTHSL